MLKKALTPAFAACLFLIVLGAKWATFDRYGSPMPDWDQWDAEGSALLIPWFEGRDFLQQLFQPHNEHRVILTKLQSLTLVLLNGQWDARLEAVSNALLHAAFAAAFWWLGYRWISPPARTSASRPHQPGPAGGATRSAGFLGAALFLLTGALFGLPFAWQNLLGGFHSQQYWLVGLALATIATLPFCRAWSAAWWCGAIAAVLALGSMGSGFVGAAVVLLVIGWRLLRRHTVLREASPSLAVAAIVVAVGVATRFEPEWHSNLKAATAHDFIFSILHSLQWPLRDQHWAALVLWLPWLVLACFVLRTPAGPRTIRRNPEPPSSSTTAEDGREAYAIRTSQVIVALGGWTLVQVVATAYARGVGADYPASRYMDTLAFGAMANGLALAWLVAWRRYPAPASDRAHSDRGSETVRVIGLGVLTLAWLGTLGAGLHRVTVLSFRHELPDARKYYDKAEGHMRHYLATDDPRALAYPDIPYPSAESLIERLANPHLRALMPVPLRAPLPLRPAAPVAAFAENDARRADPERPPRLGLSPATPPLDAAKTWGSFVAAGKGAGETGTWRSKPVVPTIPGWLKFETAGQLGDPNEGVLLELRDAATDALLARVKPDRMPGDTWRAAYVRTPERPFVVVAHDRHAARWMGFSGPVEMGRWSYRAWRAAKLGLVLLYGAGALTWILGVVALRTRSR